MSKDELTIHLVDQDKIYFPGDSIKGYIKVDLKKSSADIQNITLNFRGTIESNGEKKVILNQSQILALPEATGGKKYTTFQVGQSYKFDFEFQVPKDKLLPSSTKIPKIATILYNLIATPKKPSFNFSHTLSEIVKEVQIHDMININSIDNCREVKLNTDLGFTNDSNSTQWTLTVPKSAFNQGAHIQIQCSMNHFPKMNKLKAINISLIRYVYKTSTAKIVEKKVLSQKIIDLKITTSSTETEYIELHVPSDTPPSVFPYTGRILSISYIIQAELNMKGVKSAIKLKNVYTQEAAIIIGTFSSSSSSPPRPSSPPPLTARLYPMPSIATLTTNYQNVSRSVLSRAKSFSPAPPPMSFHGAFTVDLQPLARLDESTSTIRKSYLSKPSLVDNNQVTLMLPQPTPAIKPSSLSPSPILMDRLLTPIPLSPPTTTMNVRSTYGGRSNPINRGGPLVKPSISFVDDNIIIISSPNEIGPDDVINRGEYFNTTTTIDDEKMMKDEKQQEQVPSLIRNNTASTTSTNNNVGLMLYSIVPSSTFIMKDQQQHPTTLS